MNITRRGLLASASAAAATAMARQGTRVFESKSALAGPNESPSNGWHPLTRWLLQRAREINRSTQPSDTLQIEQTIRQVANTSGRSKPLVIKWMDTPADAFAHLSRFGLDALLDMGSASFWPRAQFAVPSDEQTFERAFEVRMLANELLGVDERDAILMAPKLLAKSDAILANVSDREVFRVRAGSSQIGWLETSLADVAAQAVADVELLLTAGASEGSVTIDHQLKMFESHEYGLLATWETPDAILCVPRIRIKATRKSGP